MSRESHAAAPADLVGAFGEAIRRYQAAVDDFDRAVAAALGINQTDGRCVELLMFEFADGATPAQLGAALGLTSGSVTTMVDRLVAAGHVVRTPHPSDARRVLVTTTKSLQEHAWALHEPIVRRGAELLARYSPAELSTMIDFFTRAEAVQREEERVLREG
ncbi:MarR family winged helix-turn-helix transcriptional regulator [Frondihabitans australicus]|uniref:DNA-binding MarR family transcriptional regulator n=1 Tax=Frondihabitans australicus TaxID=386892 RepID=A0A495IBX7_9MICO|nr:MarR family transcriptional regulator [Frondihabitans australicus]RKR73497.1 DNA-binding MarR family transcriptional regulator [Frondihabitans australicus]